MAVCRGGRQLTIIVSFDIFKTPNSVVNPPACKPFGETFVRCAEDADCPAHTRLKY
jgi:hypothetical protein